MALDERSGAAVPAAAPAMDGGRDSNAMVVVNSTGFLSQAAHLAPCPWAWESSCCAALCGMAAMSA